MNTENTEVTKEDGKIWNVSFLGFTSASSVTSVFNLQKIVYCTRRVSRYTTPGVCNGT